ncbi:MAG: DUF2585 family protein, partial [Candidatus Paceibacterota bacterium]
IEQWSRRVPRSVWWALACMLVAGGALALWAMGQPAICECGYTKFWHSATDVQSSQHLFDWYTFSHIIHGFIFYWLLTLFAPRMPFAARLVIALIPEVAWEVFENTDLVINRYRDAGQLAYFGDTVLNSVSDVLAMVGGFIYARFAPVWSTVTLIILFEIFTLYYIRDNLTLNVIMLIHSFDFIKEWQAGK